ncbi:MAG: carbohydrate ABC transporter permease [Chitinophagaceae bacterium]|nr:carbohydrate ABC transporter permease [Anaerolineae bacterium]
MADLVRPYESTSTSVQALQPRSFNWSRALTYGVLIIGTLLAVGPFLWMLSASLMTASEIAGGRLVPKELLFGNYPLAWEQANFAQLMWNSLRITFITVAGELVFCTLAAYAFARMNFYGRNTLFGIMLATMMIPAIATLIPNYLTVVWISRLSENMCGEACKWLDNWPSLTVPFMASAFNIFLLRQFFIQIPNELWEAARIDGAGHIRFLWSVVLPLSRASMMTVVMFGFIASWNSLMWPLLVVQSDDWRPIAFGLQKFVSQEVQGDFQLQMAASVIMIAPVMLLYFFTQRQFTEGIASSGLKG